MTAQAGTVYLVGAGPGDPELITVKGLKLVQTADVLIYDRLVADSLIAQATGAEKIYVGKTPYQESITQDAINALLVEKAQAGLRVVRLKGGDPFVFGRGSEEALFCSAHGVPFVIVPGVTSAIAAPAYAGIPVTHRQIATQFTVFTGHEDPSKLDTQTDFSALAKGGTLVLLMGVKHLPEITHKLIAAGLSESTPAACIEWGTTDHQRVVYATAGTLAQAVIEADLEMPATTIIGDVVALADRGLKWFTP
jgi:uroporphyrin-III C-methyltransferase